MMGQYYDGGRTVLVSLVCGVKKADGMARMGPGDRYRDMGVCGEPYNTTQSHNVTTADDTHDTVSRPQTRG